MPPSSVLYALFRVKRRDLLSFPFYDVILNAFFATSHQ